MVGYAAYSLLNQQHRGWYSWVLNSLVGFVYMFGFVMMTPQLFINYKVRTGLSRKPYRSRAVACIYVSMYACVYVCTYIRKYECMYQRMHVRMYVYMYVLRFMCPGGKPVEFSLKKVRAGRTYRCSLAFSAINLFLAYWRFLTI